MSGKLPLVSARSLPTPHVEKDTFKERNISSETLPKPPPRRIASLEQKQSADVVYAVPFKPAVPKRQLNNGNDNMSLNRNSDVSATQRHKASYINPARKGLHQESNTKDFTGELRMQNWDNLIGDNIYEKFSASNSTYRTERAVNDIQGGEHIYDDLDEENEGQKVIATGKDQCDDRRTRVACYSPTAANIYEDLEFENMKNEKKEVTNGTTRTPGSTVMLHLSNLKNFAHQKYSSVFKTKATNDLRKANDSKNAHSCANENRETTRQTFSHKLMSQMANFKTSTQQKLSSVFNANTKYDEGVNDSQMNRQMHGKNIAHDQKEGNAKFKEFKAATAIVMGRRGANAIRRRWKLSLIIVIVIFILILGLGLGLGLRKKEPETAMSTPTATVTEAAISTSTATDGPVEATTAPVDAETTKTATTATITNNSDITTSAATTASPITCEITKQRIYAIILFDVTTFANISFNKWQKPLGISLVNSLITDGTGHRKVLLGAVNENFNLTIDYIDNVTAIDKSIDELRSALNPSTSYNIGSALEAIANGSAGSVPSGFHSFIVITASTSIKDSDVAKNATIRLEQQNHHLLVFTSDQPLKEDFAQVISNRDDVLVTEQDTVDSAITWFKIRVCEIVSHNSLKGIING
ncbi:hypothetical protein Tcan_11423 [Toxocara canis]|uniref:VWFA domain-containing protein n=1 Tax=Toxocara canis TaxID=6265 RepID=A0A0B2VSG3_TOXCA|nr:hypothetical protein Tcan_11423 [Toxocara canis]